MKSRETGPRSHKIQMNLSVSIEESKNINFSCCIFWIYRHKSCWLLVFTRLQLQLRWLRRSSLVYQYGLEVAQQSRMRGCSWTTCGRPIIQCSKRFFNCCLFNWHLFAKYFQLHTLWPKGFSISDSSVLLFRRSSEHTPELSQCFPPNKFRRRRSR